MRAATSFRLLLLSAAIFAAACDDDAGSTGSLEPPVDDGTPSDVAPVRSDGGGPAAAVTSSHWADGYIKTNSYEYTVYVPAPSYGWNRAGRAGGLPTSTKPAGTTGRFVVAFPTLSSYLGSRSTLHVSSNLEPDGTYCNPVTASLVSDKVEVRCFKASTGQPANANISVVVTRNYADLAFAYAHQPTGTNYSPSAGGSWNPAGTSTVVRTGVGQYRVTFNNLATRLPAGVVGHAQVNAVGTTSGYCNAMNLYTSGVNLSVDVRCYASPTGTAVDRKFSVVFALPSDHLAYAWGDKPATASYSPIAAFSSNPRRGPIVILRKGVGSYRVDWTGMEFELLDEGNVQVTAYGGPTVCKVRGRSGNGADLQCYSSNGTPADSRFMVLYGS